MLEMSYLHHTRNTRNTLSGVLEKTSNMFSVNAIHKACKSKYVNCQLLWDLNFIRELIFYQ